MKELVKIAETLFKRNASGDGVGGGEQKRSPEYQVWNDIVLSRNPVGGGGAGTDSRGGVIDVYKHHSKC